MNWLMVFPSFALSAEGNVLFGCEVIREVPLC